MQWLIKLTQFGENKCNPESRPNIFCSGLLALMLLASLLSIVMSAVGDIECVAENKKTLYRAMSLITSVISFGSYYFLWHRYIGDCNCLVGLVVTICFVGLVAYIPNKIRSSLADEDCMAEIFYKLDTRRE